MQAVKQDQRLNKMKGLLYGYYIGALLSATPDIISKHNILQELGNIFSAVLSSDEHVPTVIQESRIKSLLFDMNKENPAVAYLTRNITAPEKIEEIVEGLLRLGVSFPYMISADWMINALCSSEKDNRAIAWLQRERESLQVKTQRSHALLDPDKEEIIVNDCSLAKIATDIVIDDKESEMVKAWINEVLIAENYNGKVSSFKDDLADAVTIKAKEVYGEQWGESAAKTYLNDMRRYVKGSAFGFEWNNLLYSSIAAVIAKGSDWEQLLAFMKSKNICDYRLAFAFYGELNGFTNLTRDFTDLLLNENSKYVASVYKEISGQLLGNEKGWKTGQSIKRLEEHLLPQEANDLFPQESFPEEKKGEHNTSIIYDNDAVMHIERFNGLTSSTRSQLVKLFDDFQKSYRSGYYSQNPQQYHRNNSDVIDHFCKWCLSKKNPKALTHSSDNSAMLDRLKTYLLEFYHD